MNCMEQVNMDMEIRQLLAQDSVEHPQFEELFIQDQCYPSSSLSSLRSLSMGSTEYSSLLGDTADIVPIVDQPHQMIIQDDNQFPPLSIDDMAITKAIMAVISSPISSSSSSSMSDQTLQQYQTHQSRGDGGAFMPYSSAPAPKFKTKKSCCSQQMIKKSISILRRIESKGDEAQTKESQPTGIKLHHIISERMRRGKLNEGFDELRSLLPRGSKKDKASVLINTTNYLKTLNSEISKLDEENRLMEKHLLRADDKVDHSIREVKDQTAKGFQSTSVMQQIEFERSIRGPCDMIQLVLQVLEGLKEMRMTSSIWLDVEASSPRVDLSAQTTLLVQIKDSNWDQESFKEAMNMMVDGLTTTP